MLKSDADFYLRDHDLCTNYQLLYIILLNYHKVYIIWFTKQFITQKTSHSFANDEFNKHTNKAKIQ